MLIDTPNNAWYTQAHWLIETPYLLATASNESAEFDQGLPVYTK